MLNKVVSGMTLVATLALSANAARAGLVEDYCSKVSSSKLEKSECMRESATAAILDTDPAVRWALFESINAEHNNAGKSRKKKKSGVPKCDEVADVGFIGRTSSMWIVRCKNEVMYVIQFFGDKFTKPMTCESMATFIGACSNANWVNKADD